MLKRSMKKGVYSNTSSKNELVRQWKWTKTTKSNKQPERYTIGVDRLRRTKKRNSKKTYLKGGGGGDEINADVDCILFKKLNVKKHKNDLLQMYFTKKHGVKLYYNQYLRCLNKDLILYNTKIENPYIGISNNLNVKLERVKYNKLITRIRKKIRYICVNKEPVFCQKNSSEIYSVGKEVCLENKMCQQIRNSIRNIPRDATLIFSDITKSLLEPLFPSKYNDDTDDESED